LDKKKIEISGDQTSKLSCRIMGGRRGWANS
jgi:hypothetical protein